MDDFKIFLEATEAAGVHVKPEVTGTLCIACIKAKNLWMLVGGSETTNLFNHVGKVTATDSWDEALDKILRGISEQISQAAERFKIAQRIRVVQLKVEIMKLSKRIELRRTGASNNTRRGSARVLCNTCTRPTHGKGICPGEKVECHSCGLTGHFKGSACRKLAGNKAKTGKGRANQIDRSGEESDTGDRIE